MSLTDRNEKSPQRPLTRQEAASQMLQRASARQEDLDNGPFGSNNLINMLRPDGCLHGSLGQMFSSDNERQALAEIVQKIHEADAKREMKAFGLEKIAQLLPSDSVKEILKRNNISDSDDKSIWKRYLESARTLRSMAMNQPRILGKPVERTIQRY